MCIFYGRNNKLVAKFLVKNAVSLVVLLVVMYWIMEMSLVFLNHVLKSFFFFFFFFFFGGGGGLGGGMGVAVAGVCI